MSDFNYEYFYFALAKKEFESFDDEIKRLHKKIADATQDFVQRSDLTIQAPQNVEYACYRFSDEKLARLSRASYFVGHWKPRGVTPLFEMNKGQSWKVSNVLDQILRQRLRLPHNVLVREGLLRVTYSSLNCWLWEVFGLATQRNLDRFHDCNLLFDEDNIEHSAKVLSEYIGDMWVYDDTIYNEEYEEYKKMLSKNKEE